MRTTFMDRSGHQNRSSQAPRGTGGTEFPEFPPAVERLEGRALLSAAVTTSPHPALSARLTTPQATPAAQPKLSTQTAHAPKGELLRKAGSALAGACAEYAAFLKRGATAGATAGSFRPRNPRLRVAADRIAVQTFATTSGATLAKDLAALGGTAIRQNGLAVSATVPLSKVNQLASLASLRSARPQWMVTRAGSTTSQGDQAVAADVARSTAGVTGAGVKVGILSDSFNTSGNADTYAADVASGDLPAGVQVLSDSPGGTDEGRAMAQLVYDTAPGASLAFATADGGQAAFANNIKALKNAGAKVIVDDVGYLDEPFFQDGPIAQAVDGVVAAGVSYFSAAGNEARRAYESAFRPGLPRLENSIPSADPNLTFGGGTSHDFDPGPGVDDLQAFTLQPGQEILLSFQWDQPYFSADGGKAGSASDVDVYVLNAAGTQVLAGSNDDNTTATGSGDPVEVLDFANTTAAAATYNLMIVKYGGPDPGLMKYVNFGDPAFSEYNTDSGTVFGHPNAAGAAAVGAAAYYQTPAFGLSPPQVEYYSSAGTTPILFDADGNRLAAPVVRQQPRFVAADGGNTTFFGQQIADGDTKPNFFGTSAAAPTAAAVGALLLSKSPSLTPAQVYGALQSTAVDMDDPSTATFDTGYDAGTGYGLIQADAALAAVAPRVQGVRVNDGSAQRSKVSSLTVTFSRPVTVTAGMFQLVQRAAAGGGATGAGANVVGTAVPVAAANPSNDGQTFVLTFSGPLTFGGSLADGIYDLTVPAAAVHDADGQSPAADFTFAFHRLYSDADGDGDSDNADLLKLRGTLLKPSTDPAYLPYFDYDASGVVDNVDVFQIRSRRGVVFQNYSTGGQ